MSSEPETIGELFTELGHLREVGGRTYVEVDDQQASDVRWRNSIPARFTDATIYDLDTATGQLAAAWDKAGACDNVLLLGATGVGKTHTAVALAQLAHEAGATIAFWPVVDLLDQLRPGRDETVIDQVKTVGLLVLDDLGGERPTDWTAERLYSIVNRRWLDRLPTIVTSNLDANDLRQAVGDRIYSRLYHDAHRLRIGGTDRRQ